MLKNTVYPAIGFTYISNGAQLVVITWLAASTLALSPMGLGVLTALMFAIQIVLLPLSGKLADKMPPTILAKWAALGLCLCHSLLLAAILLGGLNVLTLTIYALLTSGTTAIFLPAKDKTCIALLPNRLQKALALGSAFQFLGVAVGAAIAGFIDDIGLQAVLVLQALLMALAAVFWSRVRMPSSVNINDSNINDSNINDPNVNHSSAQIPLLSLLKASPALQHLLALCAFNGFMHMGFAVALFPVLGIQHWKFDSLQYALMQGVFSFGAVVVYVGNAYRKPQKYPGQAMFFCLLYTAGIAYAIAREPTFLGSYGLIFLWGVIAGYSASMSRIVLHTIANNNQRGQIVALYQMVLLGAAPLGSLACGWILHVYGMQAALDVLTKASIGVFVIFLLSRKLWAVEAQHEEGS